MSDEEVQGLGGDAGVSAGDEGAGEEPKEPVQELGKDGATSWRDQIPESLKDAADWSKFPTLESALKSLADGEKYRGSSTKVPDKDAEPEELEKFFSKLRPASPDGYEAEFPTYDGKVEWDQENVTWLKDVFHKLGIHPHQFKGFIAAHGEHTAEAAKAETAARQEALTALQKDYGASWDTEIALANAALRQIGGDELLQAVADSSLSANPTFLRSVFRLGRMFGEDGMIPGETSGALTPSSARERINEIRADKDHPFNKTSDPGHRAAVDEVARMYKIAYGE